MSRLLDKLAARLAFWHARRVSQRFLRAVENPAAAQQAALERALAVVAGSAFQRAHLRGRIATPADLQRALPIADYERFRPYIDRVAAGETAALFAPNQRLEMFATSSGTTAQRKLIPVTPSYVADYRRGWNAFGLKLLSDHPAAVLRHILQVSGRHDEGRTAAGIPYGAITGLIARTQKRIVRRFYVAPPALTAVDDPQQRYYALMRLGMLRDVAFAITANPATLLRLAQTLEEAGDALLRDVHDGTLDPQRFPDSALRAALLRGVQPAPARARRLEALRHAQDGMLRPRDVWDITFLACWTGGSLGHYLDAVRAAWGDVPIRDVGLLASEGRVTLPLEDERPAGVLDVTAGVFEFIPLEDAEAADPPALRYDQLDSGASYSVVLTNPTGLVRYRLDDVVRVVGWIGPTPVLEFLHRAGRVASVAGEKLTENQLVAAVRAVCERLRILTFDFVAAPVWDTPPYYRLSTPARLGTEVAAELDAELGRQNEEYASRRKSLRLGDLRIVSLPPAALARLDAAAAKQRAGTAEQYKRTYLFTQPNGDEAALGGASTPR